MKKTILPRKFYLRETEKVARELLGQILVVRAGRRTRRLMIVETEAYLGLSDPAAHSFHGKRTERVRAMYRPGGFSYVYLIYGMYFCLNVVTGGEDEPEAVLIRAAIALDRADRPTGDPRLCAGPGKLCRELAITKADSDLDMTLGKRLWIEEAPRPAGVDVQSAERVGVDGYGDAAHWPLRYYLRAHPAVSVFSKNL